MHPGWLILRDVGHYLPLLPLGVAMWRRTIGQEPSDDAWLLVGAMMLSFVADQAGRVLDGNDWWISHLYAPLQVILWLVVVARHPAVRMVMIVGMLVLAVASSARGPVTVPETVVAVYGGALVCLLVWQLDTPFRRAIWLYCGGTIPGLLWMASVPTTDPAWLWGWAGYQGMRVAGLLALAVALTREGRPSGQRRAEPTRPVGRPPGSPPRPPHQTDADAPAEAVRVA